MNRRSIFTILVLAFGAGLVVAASGGVQAGKSNSKQETWTGVITDSKNICGTTNTPTDCVKKAVQERGAKYALADDKTKKVYVLMPQEDAAPHAGHSVTVTGTMNQSTKTITVASIQM
jgi:hypothetical protein